MKISYPRDLNPIEAAVWAAEYVRARAELRGSSVHAAELAAAVVEANRAVHDLRHAGESA